jgi:hypothetical protein
MAYCGGCGEALRCLLRGVFCEATRVESNGGCGEAPACCVIMVATARQPAKGSDLVLSFCRTVCGVAAALRRRVPAWRWSSRCSAVCFSCLPFGTGLYFDDDFMGTRRLLAAAANLRSASIVQWSGFDQVVS